MRRKEKLRARNPQRSKLMLLLLLYQHKVLLRGVSSWRGVLTPKSVQQEPAASSSSAFMRKLPREPYTYHSHTRKQTCVHF